MIRLVLNDAQWERVAPLLPGKAGDPGRMAVDNRLFLEAVRGSPGLAHPGAIFPPRSATGTPPSSASGDGHKRAYSNSFSSCYPGTETSNMR